MCSTKRRSMDRRTFVPSFRVGLGQPTMALLEFAIVQWTFVAYVQPHPLFVDGIS
jgi:hypothetical protein